MQNPGKTGPPERGARLLPVVVSLLCLIAHAERRVVRVQPAGNGADAAALNAALDHLRNNEGGDLILERGTYTLEDGVSLDNLANVRIIGAAADVMLRAAPGVSTTVKTAAAEGQASLETTEAEGIVPGAMLELHCAGRTSTTPAGKSHTQPFIGVKVTSVSGTTLVLDRPLIAPVPAGTPVIRVYNGFEGHRGIKGHLIQNVTVDMNRDQWPVGPLNHTRHCAFFISGPYSYEKGPTGPPVERLKLVGCTIRGAHHRGFALYHGTYCGVYSCNISNTGAEGIDFDHFCTHCEAVDNTLEDCANLELNDASYCLIAGNTLRRCRRGVVIWQWCRLPDLNTGNLVLGNTFEQCAGTAVVCDRGADGNVIRANRVVGGGSPALLVRGADNVIQGNVVEGPPEAIRDEAVATVRLD